MENEQHRFHTDKIADISTPKITERDCELIMDSQAPQHLANHSQGCGAIFYTQDDPKLWSASDQRSLSLTTRKAS